MRNWKDTVVMILYLISKAIVFLFCLLPLLRLCQMFFSRAKITKFMLHGSNVIVTQKCSKGHISEWRFHLKIKDGISSGSLLLSSGVLFTGNTYTRINEFIEVANIMYIFFTKRKFMKPEAEAKFS